MNTSPTAAGLRRPLRCALRRSGLTLVELLVVVTILVILLSIAAPLFRRGVEGQKMREATRMVQGYIARAQAMAAQNRRPVGIAISRLGPESPARRMTGVQLHMVEVPPPYTGDIFDATCILRDMNHLAGPDGAWGIKGVDDDGNGTPDDISERGAPGSDDGDGMPETATFDVVQGGGIPTLVRPGDFIRFNHRGPFYQIARINTQNVNGNIEFDVVFFHGQTVWHPGLNGVLNGGAYGSDDIWVSPPAPQAAFTTATFQIYRQPQRSLAAPLMMPVGTCIDLSVSGLGIAGSELGTFDENSDGAITPNEPNGDVVIMFSPAGGVDNIYIGGIARRPQQAVHLMLGDVALVNPPDPGVPPALANVVASQTNVLSFEDEDGNQAMNDGEQPLANLMAGDAVRWLSIGHRNGVLTISPNAKVVLQPLNSQGQARTPSQLVSHSILQAREFATQSQSYGGR